MKDLFQLWPESLLFERKTLQDISDEDMKALIEKVYMPGLLESRISNVTAILCVLYEAREVDSEIFLNKVFLPWIYLKSKTSPYKQRILKEISRHKEFEENTEEDILHAVNLYRNIISELFDPLLTILYASYKFIDGEISDLFELDLHAGERQKYEYVNARLKCDTLFSGYDPEVRNAVSHTGGNGISTVKGGVEFRSVKRGTPPKIKVIKWSYDELFMHMMEALEFVNSIEICSDIFGIDSMDIISSKFNTLNQMIYYALSDEKQLEIINNADIQLEKIRSDQSIDLKDKLGMLSLILTKECQKREIALPVCKYDKEHGCLITKINRGSNFPTEDQEFISATAYLTRYSILSRTIFGKLMSTFVAHEEYSNKSVITSKLTGEILDKYISKEAGLVDLLNDGDFFENGKSIGVEVDFTALRTVETQRVGKKFPRMER